MSDKERVSLELLRNCSEEEKAKRKALILGSRELLSIYINTLKSMRDEVRKEAERAENYSLPSWAEFQADSIGSVRTFNKIISLMELEK